MPSFSESEAYKAYAALSARPHGMSAFQVDDEDGGLMIAAGELFCRVNIADEGEEVELCDTKTKFSHTGNLRAYIKEHRVQVSEVRKGKLSLKEQILVKKFYEKIIKKHCAIEAGEEEEEKEEEKESSDSELSVLSSGDFLDAENSPKSPKKDRHLKMPRKKDGSMNKAEMRRLYGIPRCSSCQIAKRNCPCDDNDCDI